MSQVAQLRTLLTAVLASNRFYRAKLRQHAFDPDQITLKEFTRSFPFTTKTEITEDQRAHPIYGSNLTYPLEQYTRCHQTSGTSGQPLRWLDTPESWRWMIRSWKEVYRAAAVEPSDRVFFAFSFGPFIGFWLAFEAAAELGCLCIPGGGMSSVARVQSVLDHRVTVLCCTPTYAIHLAEVASDTGLDLTQSCVRRLIVAGEPGGSVPSTRARLEQLWPGARVFDHHGMTEVGPVTYECPARPGVLHVNESAYLAEVVDAAKGDVVSSGVTGELVLTTLGRIGSPLLRYRTGDLVRTEADWQASPTDKTRPACPCGRSEMALVGGILGRTDDMVVIRGVNVFPSAIEDIVRSCDQIGEYRVTVLRDRALPELKIEIESSDATSSPKELADRLHNALVNNLALRVPVAVVPKGSLPRFELKARRWVQA